MREKNQKAKEGGKREEKLVIDYSNLEKEEVMEPMMMSELNQRQIDIIDFYTEEIEPLATKQSSLEESTVCFGELFFKIILFKILLPKLYKFLICYKTNCDPHFVS